MRAFAVELGQHMIRVNSVHPTFREHSDGVERGLYKLVPSPTWRIPAPTILAPFCQTFHTLPIPWVEAQDISNAVLFLASDESRYITGVALPIDAGSCLK